MNAIDEADHHGWPERQLILFDGERQRGLEAAAELVAKRRPKRLVWIGNGPIPDPISAVVSGRAPASDSGPISRPSMGADHPLIAEAIPPAKVQRLLGGECDLLAIDLWSGLDADAIGAAVGSLRGGGLLLLLTPGLAAWPRWVDPEAARIAVHPYSAAEVGTRFIARLARLLQAYASAKQPEPAAGKRASTSADGPCRGPRKTPDRSQPATPDQAEAIAAICQLAAGRARRPLVLTADRGRGKSAALGIAAGRLIATHRRQIIVTAPRRSAADTLFEHARITFTTLSVADWDSLLCFQAPDALLLATTTTPAADLLLIDEAAGIPAPLLEQLLMRYRRICFATTVHGYEGSGRGFDLRFRALLDQRTPGWRSIRLLTPIRWRQGDWVEALINQVLLLDAEPASDTEVAAADLAAAQFRLHDRAALAENEPLLRQVFGLLLLGHYQTRPNDLRHLLDGPNLAIASLSVEGRVLATALIAQEGRLEPALIQPIFEGRRRPRGHLLPQTLSAHAGLREAPRLGYARIVRIAVHPAARRRGLGRRLVEALSAQARADGLDLLGASFGASAALLSFWHRCGLDALHLGTGRNAASGARAAVVLQALSAEGQALIAQARHRLARDLPSLLSGPLQTAEPAIVASLLRALPRQPALIDLRDQQQIDAFADAHRTLEAALPALERLVRERLTGETRDAMQGAVSKRQRDLLILSILQRRRSDEIASILGLRGRAGLVQALREAIAKLRSSSEHPGQ